jgi:hypothetical protein
MGGVWQANGLISKAAGVLEHAISMTNFTTIYGDLPRRVHIEKKTLAENHPGRLAPRQREVKNDESKRRPQASRCVSKFTHFQDDSLTDHDVLKTRINVSKMSSGVFKTKTDVCVTTYTHLEVD